MEVFKKDDAVVAQATAPLFLSRLKSGVARHFRLRAAAVALTAFAVPALMPTPAAAWWYRGPAYAGGWGAGWRGPGFYGPGYYRPGYVGPVIVGVPGPVIVGGPAWIRPHWNGPYWVPGHWR